VIRAAEARAARREVEEALTARGWPWARRLSLWVDALVVLEENPA
jgi:hypothetical protein